MSKNKNLFPQVKGRRGNGGKRKDLNDIYFRSSWEANWARYLNWLKSLKQINSWEFEPETFEFKAIKKGSRFYTPDFKILNPNNSVEYHEIKGYMDERSATKLKRMAKYFPEVKLILIGKKEYRSIANAVGKNLPFWEAAGKKPARDD